MNLGGWNLHTCQYVETKVFEFHIVPANDLREHECDMDCFCKPVRTEEKGIACFVHNALDKREDYEQGQPLN